jgi:hypothetical protein
MKAYMTKDPFAQDSHELKNTLLQEVARLSDEIDKLERTTEQHTAYYAYLKDFLINSGVLCDDILQAVHNDVVLLAVIGTRVLLEDTINAHYLESKTDENERTATATDWFRLSNDPKAYKNKLDDKAVAQRAKEAGTDTEAMHDSEYADFCNYTHSSAQRSILNVPSQRVVVAQKAVVASLKAYANTVMCLARIIGETTPQSVTDNASSFLDKYRKSVTEAALPPLT